MIFQKQLKVRTEVHGGMHDLTEEVNRIVEQSRVKTGIAHVFNVGSTAAIGTIEFEAGLRRDLPSVLDRLVPPDPAYGHEQSCQDGNGHSHLQATLLAASVSVPIGNGRLLVGVWQQIFVLECDIRSRDRTVIVTIMGE